MKYPIKKEFFPHTHNHPPISRLLFSIMKQRLTIPRDVARDERVEIGSFSYKVSGGEQLSAFIISPKSLSGNAPALVFFHGGGFVFTAAAYHFRYAVKYALELNCRVVIPDYRLAPKYPFPTFLEDCYSAAVTLYDIAGELGIDRHRIGFGGDSAGGTLTVGTTLMLADRGHSLSPLFNMLICPYLDARGESDSAKKYTDTPMWNSKLSKKVAPLIAASADAPEYKYFSSVEADGLDRMPPTYIETAEFDPLRDDGILYASLLRAEGVTTIENHTEGTMHCFEIKEDAPTTKEAYARRIDFMSRYFAN